jgi:hypothetical protein
MSRSRNPWGSEPHHFVVEELLDPVVVRSPNSHAPVAAAGRSVPSELERQDAEKKAEVADDGVRTR